MTEARWYGVSSGNGNDGVSHTFADYYVKTNEPYRLADLAMITQFESWNQKWATDRLDTDGEAEYTISCVIHDSKEVEDERDEMRQRAADLRETGDDEDAEQADELENEADEYGTDYAEYIIDVFPCEPDEQCEGRPTYESLEACFGDDCRLVEPETV